MNNISTRSSNEGSNPYVFKPLGLEYPSSLDDMGPEVLELVAAESHVPVEVKQDFSLRAKILDACGLTCNFCHNEGTPVAIDNPGSKITIRNQAGKSGRVSVFSATNNVDFIPGKMDPNDPEYARSLRLLGASLGFRELHLTGGEPTLHPKLAEVISVATDCGYEVGMTSNGENGSVRIPEAAQAGLRKINFSIFGTTPTELAEVQHEKFKNEDLAKRKLEALQSSISCAADHGINVAANIVMSSKAHSERVMRLISDFDSRLNLRLLPDLSSIQQSSAAIYGLLASMKARPVLAQIEAGSSNSRVQYTLPNGRIVTYKQIRSSRLDACNGCSFNNDQSCMEGFYGTRLYIDREGRYKVGLCIQRMDLVQDVDDFVRSDLRRQVQDLRKKEYANMSAIYSK